MANTKTQKPLTLSKKKSELIFDWFVNDSHWNIVSQELELGKTAVFRYKNNLKKLGTEISPFEALAETFTLKQLNLVIKLYNDSIEHPEKHVKRKKKQPVDLKKQAETVNKHLKDMNMNYEYDEKNFKNEDKEK